eukprot:5019288-Amphidinium_carterae.1
MLGLNTITTNNLKLEIQGCSGYLSNNEVQIRLHYIRHRFYIKAAIMNGYYNEEDYTKEFASWYNIWYNDFDTENMVYGIGSEDDASTNHRVVRNLRQRQRHLKCRQQYHRRGGLKQQNMTQINY